MCATEENPEDRLHELFERCRQSQVGVVPFMSREIRTHLNGVLCALQVIEQQGIAALTDDVAVYQAMHISAIRLFSEVDLLLMYIRSTSG